MCGVKTNIVTAVEISGPFGNGSLYFAPLVQQTGRYFRIGEVLDDKSNLSRANLVLAGSWTVIECKAPDVDKIENPFYTAAQRLDREERP